ncbi:MBL fold metallo-hydrolase [Lysobacter pythonis]|uniref:MBL fold metallo-hydrolase n=1 Tax=Solilutibacter pythonis TaxID=2483112 RepID=A0A3M2HZ02_9GAMM|nr:MBL fold metallo-hydrolase [Lysobacter pythonis]RMH93425.1 MBL fold metallo-hydrolase [Lysobacter pythonis]
MIKPEVHPFFHAESNTWSYMVADAASGRAALIDTVLDYDFKSGRTSTASARAIADVAHGRGLTVEWLLETHAHADHLSAAHWLKSTRYHDARIAIGAGITQVQKVFRPVFNLGEHFPVDGSQFDHLFEDGENFTIGNLSARVIAVPGHTSDSNAFLIGDALFVGDSLFMPDGGTARCDFPGGSAATLYRSIQRLYALPDHTRVFVCHDYGPGGREFRCETSIGEEKLGNIHLRADTTEAAFVAMRETRDAGLDMPKLILPAVQLNIRAGAPPAPEDNGVRYLKIPLDTL